MRKTNTVLSIVIAALFVFHVFIGAGEMLGWMPGAHTIALISAVLLLLAISLHIIFGIKLTADTLIAVKRSGANYFSENILFWVRRISGLAVIVFITTHFIAFSGKTVDGVYNPRPFGIAELILAVLLLLSLLLHLTTNIRPLMLAFGKKVNSRVFNWIALGMAALLLFAGAGFISYYIWWLQ